MVAVVKNQRHFGNTQRPALAAAGKITSSILLPRRYLALCSPSTQRIASEMLLLPLPLGPTIAVMPEPKLNSILSAKDLNP